PQGARGADSAAAGTGQCRRGAARRRLDRSPVSFVRPLERARESGVLGRAVRRAVGRAWRARNGPARAARALGSGRAARVVLVARPDAAGDGTPYSAAQNTRF